jgi:uncharacterized protein YceH (UPF0502 family)
MDPEIRLDAHEARLLGVLVEKALTTPEQYPLTLNAAVAGANQKSNREPVLSLSDDEVSAALEGLIAKELVRRVFPGNSRVDKYCHTGTSTLKIDVAALAILAELLMRGPQTPGELRTRAGRMAPIESLEHLAALTQPLLERELIQRLPPGVGSRAERYAQTLCPGLHPTGVPDTPAPSAFAGSPAATTPTLPARVAKLESEVERLRRQLRSLAEKLGEPPEEES